MAAPILYGPTYSTYARSARLAFEEKEVGYTLKEVDTIRGEAQKPDYLAKHPFGKVPTLEHDGFMLYETTAIVRYIDEGFPGPKLQPADLKRRARMNQIMGIIDSYAYGTLIGKIVIQRLVAPLMGGGADEAVIAEAAAMARKSVDALESLADRDGPFLCGPDLSLADLYLAPIAGYFSMTPEGETALGASARLSRWWDRIRSRPSLQKTQPRLG